MTDTLLHLSSTDEYLHSLGHILLSIQAHSADNTVIIDDLPSLLISTRGPGHKSETCVDYYGGGPLPLLDTQQVDQYFPKSVLNPSSPLNAPIHPTTIIRYSPADRSQTSQPNQASTDQSPNPLSPDDHSRAAQLLKRDARRLQPLPNP